MERKATRRGRGEEAVFCALLLAAVAVAPAAARTPGLENRQSTIGNHQFFSGYSTYLGGLGFDVATDVAVGSTGSVYVTGYTNSAGFPPASVTRIGPGGGSCGSGADVYPCFDAFVAKLDPTGSRLEYVTYFGGSGDDYATGIAVDGSGNAYVTGFTNSADWPTAHAPQASPGGGLCGNANPEPCFDAFVAKLDATGTTLVYSTYLGGSADDYGQGIAVDSAGSVVVTGFTASADFPTGHGTAAKRSRGPV